MSSSIDRRSFFGVSAAAGLALSGGRARTGSVGARSPAADPGPGFPSQDSALVRAVVGAAHVDLDRVQALVGEYPELAKASFDWGFGDWESALGAASHTGRREIALFLIEHGARPTLFSATMLGQLDVVRSTVEASPGAQRIPGPHGIPLLAHAEAGGEAAAAVYEYLDRLGDAGLRPQSEALSDTDLESLLGTFRYGPAEDELLEVTSRNGSMFIGRRGHTARGTTHLGDLRFHPAGAPSVQVRFVSRDLIEVIAGGTRAKAPRVG
jgi:hypothetical protein